MRLGGPEKRLLQIGRGCFSVNDVAGAGVSQARVRALVTSGVLFRIGRGVFASADQLERLDPWEAHAVRARGFARSFTSAWVAGWSAVAVRKLRRLGPAPEVPTLVVPSSGRSGSDESPYGVVRHCALPESYRGQYAGCPVVASSWLAIDLARHVSRPASLVVVDGVLASGTSRPGLLSAHEHIRTWPGSSRSAWAVEHGDPRSESVLETLGRWICIDRGLPVPLSNVWVGLDRPVYRVDHLWPWHWVVAEADGALKYRAGDAAAVVREEKERQWYLEQELGLRVVRYGWDLAARSPATLAERFSKALANAGRRETPIRWWADPRELTHLGVR